MPRGRVPAEFTREQWEKMSEDERNAYRHKKSLEGIKKWTEDHKDIVKQQKKEYYQRNKDLLNARSKKYYSDLARAKTIAEEYEILKQQYEELKRQHENLMATSLGANNSRFCN